MNILLTNDDGYEASGINQLFQSLSTEHKVFLIAPRDNCSGMSAAISLRTEIKVEESQFVASCSIQLTVGEDKIAVLSEIDVLFDGSQ